MVVEDNPSDVFIIREALAYHNIDAELTWHQDGEQMIHYIERLDSGESSCPDIILLDLNLPRRSGKAVLARMRSSPICGNVPVVIVTSSKAEDGRDAVKHWGATRYFHKSIDYDESMRLGEVVLEVIGQKPDRPL